MPSIRERNGKYHVQVRLVGFPTQTASFDRRTDAKAWAAQTETALREGRHFPTREAQRRMFAELVDRHVAKVERDRPDALRKQRQHMGWWKQKFGKCSLAGVTPEMIASARDELLAENIGTAKESRRRSPTTAKRYLATLSKAMEDAVREYHWLSSNPVRRVSKPKEPEGRVRYLSIEEREGLLEACRASELRELELIVTLAITAGPRKGEILGLRWPDVDLKRGQAVLNKTKNREKRAVPLVPRVIELLQAHAKVRRLDSDLIFQGTGKVDHWFGKALEAAKIEDFRFHDLRHTAASYLAMSGATLLEIGAVLGHKTAAMTKRYSHLANAHTSAVVARMAEKFLGNAAA